MYKKTIIIFIFLISHAVFSETCPHPFEIKADLFQGWQPFNANSGEPITDPQAINQFKKEIDQFALAEWMPDAPEGPSHCYYNGLGEPLEIYLVKTTREPAPHDSHWIVTALNILHCQTSIQVCRFQD